MSVFEAIVLGLVQGLTEFLPISSSAHLIVVPWALGWEEPGLAFDAALHLGTLVAVLFYFRRDFVAMARALPRALRGWRSFVRGETTGDPRDDDARLVLFIAIATIPGLVAGVAGQSAIEDFFHGDDHRDLVLAIIAVFMMAIGLLLLAAERIARHDRKLTELTLRDAVTIGISQATALLPGVSRSGATITTGLFRGLRRADAARFSFLLGTPLIAGAGAKGLLDVLQTGLSGSEVTAFVSGMIASGVSGFAAIWALLHFLQRSNTVVFVLYRLGAGVAILALIATGVR